MNLIIILTIIVLSLSVLIVCIVKNFKNNQLQFNNSYSGINKSSSNVVSSTNNLKSPTNSLQKAKKKIYYSEATLNKQEFFYDKSTTNNPRKIKHASLQIGEGNGEWSRMSSTTSPTKKHKKDYIKLDNLTNKGKVQYLNTKIKTNSINTRENKANRSSLTDRDLMKIKKAIYTQIK